MLSEKAQAKILRTLADDVHKKDCAIETAIARYVDDVCSSSAAAVSPDVARVVRQAFLDGAEFERLLSG